MSITRRDEWTFAYTAHDLLGAVRGQMEHHTERLEHWTGKRNEREQKLRAEGIDMRAAVRPGVGNSTAYYGQPKIDTTLFQDYSEAQERVDYHTTQMGDFVRWSKLLLCTDAGRLFDLTLRDVEYFGLFDGEPAHADGEDKAGGDADD